MLKKTILLFPVNFLYLCFIFLFPGLRGAIAFALVLLIDKNHIPLQPMFMTTTIAVVYFTVFLQGITIKPLVKILNVKRADKRKPTMNERIHERVLYLPSFFIIYLFLFLFQYLYRPKFFIHVFFIYLLVY